MSGTRAVPNHPGIYSYEVKKGLASKRKRYAFVATVLVEQKWGRGFTTIAEAEHAREEMKEALRSGTSGGTAKLTVGEYLENRWLPSMKEAVTAGSFRSYKVTVARIVPILGKVRLARVTPLDVEQLKTGLSASGLGPASVKQTFNLFQQSLTRAVKWQLLSRNPCELVDRPKGGRYRPTEFEDLEQLHKLLVEADKTEIGTLVYMAVVTGMRQGELLKLKWSDIDMGTGVLNIPVAKTRAGERGVALAPATVERLRQHREEQLARYYELDEKAGQLVFVNPSMSKWDPTRLWHRWNPIRTAVGLPTMHFHDLRHANSSLMGKLGVHPSVMASRLGHSDPKLTLDVYTHSNVDDQRQAAAAIEAWLQKAS